MRAPQYKPVRKYGFNMTPMIDVVFLLIIFFLVSSHLAKQENQIELSLPVAASSDDDIPQEVSRVTVNVKGDGTHWIRGRQVGKIRLSEILNSAVTEQKEGVIEVRIRGSRQAPYSAVEPIMLACTEAGIWNVTYAVYREEQR
ncbi:MAG: biopolymer transporter ExbD [Planctomycetota bacterium]